MPIPQPGPTESKPDFMPRCMEALAGEFPDRDQRFAVCSQQWETAKAKAHRQRNLPPWLRDQEPKP